MDRPRIGPSSRSLAVSNIPFSAISNAFLPVQQANENLRARKLQSQKVFHHAEEVEELDDTAVNSVTDEEAGNNNGGQDPQQRRKPTADSHELLDIPDLAPQLPLPIDTPPPVAHLDISA
jgi:hypothetical protein